MHVPNCICPAQDCLPLILVGVAHIRIGALSTVHSGVDIHVFVKAALEAQALLPCFSTPHHSPKVQRAGCGGHIVDNTCILPPRLPVKVLTRLIPIPRSCLFNNVTRTGSMG